METWIDQLASLLPASQIAVSDQDLLKHSCDSWSIAIKTRQQGKKTFFPEVVVYPHDEDEVARLLAWATENKISVTPWGAGSAVTGAPLPLTGGITVDMSGMDQILSVDETNLMVTVQAGTMGGSLEEELNRRGFTLNHSPQSLGISTVGGWVATRSTGQFSSRYGGIEDLIISLTVVLSSGEIVKTKPTVRPAMGPDWRQLFLGAEGTLGIVTEITLKIFPISNHRLFEAVEFDSVLSGLGVMQRIMQSGLAPFLIRFYDQDESRHLLRDETYARCVMFLGFEGLEGVATAEYEAAMEICRSADGTALGQDLVLGWMERRFDFSAVENIQNNPSGVAETIEVAHFWDGIYETYAGLKKAMAPYVDQVLAHFSHAYPQGTSLYIILLGAKGVEKDAAEAEETLRRIWKTASEVALQTGAATAHHHGTGIVRLPVVREELGSSMKLLERVKHSLDPSGILCPGKLGIP